MEILNVFLLDRFAGTLSYDGKNLVFQYDPVYLEDKSAAPVSFSMPLQSAPFDSKTTRVFFENLLPPEHVRKKLGKILHISRHNIFGFLKAIGGDCAGAISLYSDKSSSAAAEPIPPHRRELSYEEAVQVLAELPKRPLNIGNEAGFRISGTGAQDKLIACVEAGRIFLPLYGAPSTHIIKPPVPEYPDSVFNELFCMRLAEKVGIPAPYCEVIKFADVPYYCVARFDRLTDKGVISRLHQEDFCQALCVEAEKKYETEGGPGIPECFRLICEKRIGAAGQIDFIRRVVFNYLLGNGDAHAKNFSVLFHGNKASLAPVYDLLCTEIYPELAHETAMSIGNETEFCKITRKSFVQMADDCQIRPAAVLDQLDKITAALAKSAALLSAELNAIYPSAVYAKEVISKVFNLNG